MRHRPAPDHLPRPGRHRPPDVEEVHRRANAIDPKINIATVYRTVRLFEAGILEKHDFGDGRSRQRKRRRPTTT